LKDLKSFGGAATDPLPSAQMRELDDVIESEGNLEQCMAEIAA
jgi:hypothetical protein